ncbi:hypothetical protein DC345_11910 [Paenibacillus taichungensis]|uniref:Uncharacterized protein n=1 Tax=Paenibacillus taichungensis TaxID=484184 RepID=A0A329QUP5_9BACL|nr:hypothetical protein [Paenibacillus taichungensis]RAW16170.1 hypothetical protein DC345_11910 [Paenibacillus taichungensis]
MKKELGVLMVLSVVLLSGCGSDKPTANPQDSGESPSKQVTTQPVHSMNEKLLGSSEDEKVKFYKQTDGVTLDINGNKKEFSWNVPVDTGTAPQVFYTDVTGDGKEEAVIIIQTGRGTGLNNYDIHVVNAEDLSEIKVQSYEEIVADQIETHVAKNGDGTLAISVKAQGKEYDFNYGFDPAPDYKQDSLAFGGVNIYSLENQKIKLNLGGSVGVSPTYVCDFNITYKFDSAKNEFLADQIEVKPIEK